MKQIKLLVLTTTFPRWDGDVTTAAFIFNLCRQLVKDQNISITILCPHGFQAKLNEMMDGLHVIRFPYFFPKRYQKLVYHGGVLPNIRKGVLPKAQIPFLFISELYHTLKILKNEQYDVIHSHWILPSGLIGALCHKIRGVKHVMTIHAVGLVALGKIPGKRILADFIFENSDHITLAGSYINERLRTILSSRFSNEIERKTISLPFGAVLSDIQKKANKKALKKKYKLETNHIILSLGRLIEKKGVRYLVKAMPKILENNKDVMCIICGEGPQKKKLEDLVKKLELTDNVRFTGHVTNEEKIEYLSLTDILVVPSIVTQGGYTDGLPTVIQEGLTLGLPIIASDVGGIQDLIIDHETGVLVQPKSPNSIAQAVETLLTNEELRNNIAIKGRLFADERLSSKTIVDQCMSLFTDDKDSHV